MVPYNQKPSFSFKVDNVTIDSFVQKTEEENIDWTTVDSFGDEWGKFNSFTPEEIQEIGNDYFDIVAAEILQNATVLDMGCGSGRWSKYLSERVKWIEAIDPSHSVAVASQMLAPSSNVRVTQGSVDNIPFAKESFDLVISLGVLHHIPDTQQALKKCVEMVKKGGHCLIYLYYNLDNRPMIFRMLFAFVNAIRNVISQLPGPLKKFTCDLLAVVVYFPLSRFSRLFKKNGRIFKQIPLSYYHDKSMTILRNDSLDRFGTPLEQRFTKSEIEIMMSNCGLTDITFSKNAPFWHAIGKKA